MNAKAAADRPNIVQYVLYCYGKRLPASMSEWVIRDLSGPGAALRMVIRWAIPCILLLLPFMFVPGGWYVRSGMTIPILIPYIYFAVALNGVYRRHRLSQHGLDPELAGLQARKRDELRRIEYERQHRW